MARFYPLDLATRHRFRPGTGTPGGVTSGAASFMSGMAGMGRNSENYSIRPGASIDPRFASAAPGVYSVQMIVEAVPLAQSTLHLHSAAPYNAALRAQGVNATVTKVRYVRNENLRDSNWASSILLDTFGGGNSNKNAVVDMVFDVTVQIDPTPTTARVPGSPSASMPLDGSDWGLSDPTGVSGLGVVQIGAGAVFAAVAVIAVVLAATFPGFGKVVLASVKFVGAVAGSIVGGAAGAVAENAVPILIAVGVGALAIWLMKKGGASYRSKSGRFSF